MGGDLPGWHSGSHRKIPIGGEREIAHMPDKHRGKATAIIRAPIPCLWRQCEPAWKENKKSTKATVKTKKKRMVRKGFGFSFFLSTFF
jgi:hypothetical protein